MIEKLTTKVSINTQGEAIRFANACYEVAEEFAIGFAEWCVSKEKLDLVHDLVLIGELNRDYTTKELLEIYKKEKL